DAIAAEPAPTSGDCAPASLAQGPPVAGSSLPHRRSRLDAGSPGGPLLSVRPGSAGALLCGRARIASRAGSQAPSRMLLPLLFFRDEPCRSHRPCPLPPARADCVVGEGAMTTTGKVLIFLAADRMTGPAKGLFQLFSHSAGAPWDFVLALF